METVINVGIPLLILVLGYVLGRVAEARHYDSIRKREGAFAGIPALTGSHLDGNHAVEWTRLTMGSVVVSVDYYKRFLSAFRMIFGGEMHSYSSLIDRGRREAILRMKETCPGADIFINCRLETSSISKGQGKNLGSVEVIAYSTGVKYAS